MSKTKNKTTSLAVKRAAQKVKKIQTKVKRSGMSEEESKELLGEATSYLDGTDLALGVYTTIQEFVKLAELASVVIRNPYDSTPVEKLNSLADLSFTLASTAATLIAKWNIVAEPVAGKKGDVPPDMIMSYFSTYQQLGLLNDEVIQTLSGYASSITELLEEISAKPIVNNEVKND